MRTLARTEMFMPTKPVTPDSNAPSTKPAADSRPEEQEHDRGDDHADDGDRHILAAQIGDRAFLDRTGDFDHALVAGGRAQSTWRLVTHAVKQRDDAAGDGDDKADPWSAFPVVSANGRAGI